MLEKAHRDSVLHHLPDHASRSIPTAIVNHQEFKLFGDLRRDPDGVQKHPPDVALLVVAGKNESQSIQFHGSSFLSGAR